jgi:hypothetical protein
MLVSVLIIGIPIATAISIPVNKSTSLIKDAPPNWANGNFTGVWGLDIWGENHIPLGWMFGYYKLGVNIGYFAAGFNYFEEQDIAWFIQGYIFGIFMFGTMDSNEYTNQSFFVGIGNCNETHYHWRIIGENGPTFFMHGKYTIFETSK